MAYRDTKESLSYLKRLVNTNFTKIRRRKGEKCIKKKRLVTQRTIEQLADNRID